MFESEFGSTRNADHPGAFSGAADRCSWYHGVTVDAGTSPNRAISISALFDRSWNNLDLDLGAGKFPRVSPAALADPNAPLDPGPADSRSFAGTLTLQPTGAVRFSQSYEWNRLTRIDTGRDAYRQHLFSSRAQVSFSRFIWLRSRLDFDSLDDRVFHQFVFGWTPKPGRSVYAGYDETGDWLADDHTPGSASRRRDYARRSRTIFLKLSWSRIFSARRREDASPALSLTTTSPS